MDKEKSFKGKVLWSYKTNIELLGQVGYRYILGNQDDTFSSETITPTLKHGVNLML